MNMFKLQYKSNTDSSNQTLYVYGEKDGNQNNLFCLASDSTGTGICLTDIARFTSEKDLKDYLAAYAKQHNISLVSRTIEKLD